MTAHLLKTSVQSPSYLLLSKELKCIVHNRLLEEISRQNPISDNHWGFSQGKSTVSALLTAVDN